MAQETAGHVPVPRVARGSVMVAGWLSWFRLTRCAPRPGDLPASPSARRCSPSPEPGQPADKPESLQPTGAFKLRGAYNAISALPATAKANGVVAHSKRQPRVRRRLRGRLAQGQGRDRRAR